MYARKKSSVDNEGGFAVLFANLIHCQLSLTMRNQLRHSGIVATYSERNNDSKSNHILPYKSFGKTALLGINSPIHGKITPPS